MLIPGAQGGFPRLPGLQEGERLPLPQSLCGIAFGVDRKEDILQEGASLYMGPIK